MWVPQLNSLTVQTLMLALQDYAQTPISPCAQGNMGFCKRHVGVGGTHVCAPGIGACSIQNMS